jgi:hypothetical protein
LDGGIKMGKSLYISIDSKETEEYKTINTVNNNDEITLPARKILPLVCKYAPPCAVSLFKLKRDIYCENNLKTEYWNHWLYHAVASGAHVWKKRVETYRGYCDHIKKTIEFPNDELFDSFYEEYEYEPDEQPLEIQNKNIPPLHLTGSWKDFYEKYRKNGIFQPDYESLCELDKVIY